MVSAVILPNPKAAFITSAGAPAVGYKLYTYDAGTLTPRATYLDKAGGASNTNPIVLDARGEAVIFWDGSYKVILKDASDVPIWTVDNFTSSNLTCAFLAYLSAPSANLTGSGATAAVPFDTEVFDLGSNFAANTFTAPKTGYYHFDVSVESTDLTAIMTGHTLNFVTTSRTYRDSFSTTPTAGGSLQYSISVLAFMTAGDTASVNLTITGGAGNTADIVGGAVAVTYFSGFLVG